LLDLIVLDVLRRDRALGVQDGCPISGLENDLSLNSIRHHSHRAVSKSTREETTEETTEGTTSVSGRRAQDGTPREMQQEDGALRSREEDRPLLLYREGIIKEGYCNEPVKPKACL
jgi:hypothetical protein